MRKLQRSVLASAIALAIAASGNAAAQFSNVYFFGDSLTDAGSFKPVLPPGTGLFTTNPGPVWAQVFGANYGITVTPANQGGTDYAQGGARVINFRASAIGSHGKRGADRHAGDAIPGPGSGKSESVLFGLGWRERHLHAIGSRAGGARDAGTSAGRHRTRRDTAGAGGLGAARGRGGVHHGHQRAGHRQDTFRRRIGPRGADHLALVVLQHHAVRRA